MMEYEIFKGVVGEKFKEFLPEKYQDAQVEIRPVDKVNRTLDGLSIRGSEPGMNISPTIYVNHMYEDYVTTENLNATLERAAEGFVNAILSRNVKLITTLIANTRRIPYTPSGGHYVSGLSKTCGQLSSVTGRNDFYQYTSYRVCRVPDAKS